MGGARYAKNWTERPCAKCGETKPRKDFSKHGPKRGNYCRPCYNQRQKEYRDGLSTPRSPKRRRCLRCRELSVFSGNYCIKCLPFRTPAEERYAVRKEDIVALAESVLYPGIPYTNMTRMQRLTCAEWARQECTKRGLAGFGGQRPGREKAAA